MWLSTSHTTGYLGRLRRYESFGARFTACQRWEEGIGGPSIAVIFRHKPNRRFIYEELTKYANAAERWESLWKMGTEDVLSVQNLHRQTASNPYSRYL